MRLDNVGLWVRGLVLQGMQLQGGGVIDGIFSLFRVLVFLEFVTSCRGRYFNTLGLGVGLDIIYS